MNAAALSALIAVLLLTGCAPRISPEQAKIIDSNFATVIKANQILEARIKALEDKTQGKTK